MNKVINSFLNLNYSLDDKYKSSKRVLVIGAGISGKACARWMEKDGKKVTLVDSRELDSKKIVDSNILIRTSVKFPLGESWFDQVDLLVVSPGLSPHVSKNSGLAPMLEITKKKNIPVLTELDVFDVANNCYSKKTNENSKIPVIAVTGTNGKTSVVKLTTKLLNSIGLDAQYAGNIRPSLMEAFLERKNLNRMPDIWVLELSSFQLALSNQFSPTFSTILNLSDDHFDWHLNTEEYLYAKLKVFGIPNPTAKAFVCRDDPALSRNIYRYFKSTKSNFNNITFGAHLPLTNPSFGISKTKKFCFRKSSDQNDFFEFPVSTQEVNLIGNHNYSNITCCLAITSELSKNFSKMAHVLKKHIGEPHRLESFLTINNINYIDDSKATNVAATISAIKSLQSPLILILGGLTKGQNFNLLTETLDLRSINLIVFGKNVSSICESFKNSSLLFEKVNSLKEAVTLANKIAKKKALLSQKKKMQINVLLSPACSSLDMYKNYQHRGEEFKKLVSGDFCGEKIC